MIGGNIRKEVLKRENRYKFYDENNKLIKEEFYYKDVDTGKRKIFLVRKNFLEWWVFCCTIGNISKSIIEKYIQNQG